MRSARRTPPLPLAGALCLLTATLAAPALAGPMVLDGTWKDGALAPPEAGAAARDILLAEVEVEVEGDHYTARWSWRAAPGDGAATIVVPLPAGAEADATALTRGDAPVAGWFLDAGPAEKALAGLAEATGDTALLAAVGRPLFISTPTALEPHDRLTLRTRAAVAERDGLRRIDLPLPQRAGERAPRIRGRLVIAADEPVRAVISPTHPIDIHRPDPRRAAVRLGIDRATADGDWTVMWAVDRAPLGLRLLTHRDDDADGGWFALLGNPSGGDGGAPIAKDVVLALDTSGSMRGEKMEQARLAVEAVLDRLGPHDRFDIVAFGTEVKSFAGRPVPRGDGAVARARGFVEDLVAHGRTNIADALAAALADPAPDRPRIVLFLTDGTPTAGLREPEKIVDGLPKRGEGQARVFAFGVGHDVNAHLLDSIAERTGGDTTYVNPGEAIDVKVAALYEGLSHPVLEDVVVDFGELEVEAVHPMRIPLLFRGRDVLILGRYTGSGRHTLTLRGTVQGKPQSHAVTADFPAQAQPENGFVATLWATRRVGELLRRMRLADGDGDRQKTLAEIVELSRRFGILTEYTAFIADSDAPIDAAEANRTAAELLQRANAQQSGQWAVRQADNEQALRKRTVASTAGNVYRDRQGKTRKGAKVRMMHGRAWYKRDGRWVEAEDGKQRTRRRVKKFSKAYMDLVRENADFAEAQRLDGDMTINLDGEQVEVY